MASAANERRPGGLAGLSRAVRGRAAVLFARNTVASCFSFAIDLLLLWLLVRFAGLGPLAAAAPAFLAAITIHYWLCRIWVFRGTARGVAAGYVYFLINAGVGLAITMALFAALVELAGLHYLAARVLASVAAGIVVFLLNAVLNFGSLSLTRRTIGR
ncbi:MAG TPA: GtrA family protein [Allosphingosinicella sp.]|nr:GtrA family protein [Allosphingosinicella sp.]